MRTMHPFRYSRQSLLARTTFAVRLSLDITNLVRPFALVVGHDVFDEQPSRTQTVDQEVVNAEGVSRPADRRRTYHAVLQIGTTTIAQLRKRFLEEGWHRRC